MKWHVPYNQKKDKHWGRIPGWSGNVKRLSEFINVFIYNYQLSIFGDYKAIVPEIDLITRLT
jgi:hypothetical protein